MNELAISLIWVAVRLTLFGLLAMPVYLLARRRGPAAGSLAALSCLLAAGAVTALSLAPWPAWWNWNRVVSSPGPNAARGESDASPRDWRSPGGASAVDSQALQVDSAPDPLAAAPLNNTSWRQIWHAWTVPSAAAPDSYAGWSLAVVAVMLGASLAGCGRLLLGLWAVRHSRSDARPIEDPSLSELLAELTGRLNYRGRVALAESSGMGTPATVGWRRPLILLPANWRQWTAAERRAVLAHELAHIRRADFLAGILAQASLACHFWHPLMHWFVGRLRLEQELAADACGVRCAGGREAYLVALAQMALRQDRPGVSWAARPFLPGRGIFLRRIEMLRTSSQRDLPLGKVARGGLLALLASAGLVVTALRSPGVLGQNTDGQQVNKASTGLAGQGGAKPAAASAAADTGGFDLTFVPNDALALIALKPAEIFGRPELATLAKMLEQSIPLGVQPNEIELAQLILIADEPQQQKQGDFPAPFGLLLRAAAENEFTQLIQALAPEGAAAQYLGQSYYASPSRMCYFRPDERTIVLDTEAHVFQYLLAKKRPKKRVWEEAWSQIANGQLAVMVNVETARQIVPPPPGLNQGLQPQAAFAPLWEQTQRVVLGVTLGERISVNGLAICESADAAGNVHDTVQASLTLAGNLLGRLKRQVGSAPADQAGPQLLLVDSAEELLAQAHVEREEKVVRLTASATADVATFGILLPAVQSSRQAARRVQGANNLKQIALAMHNYADTHQRFPAAVVLGPDGKTPHSWRVELLPYLDQESLYRQYKMDEPWDSANNLKVLAQMPAVFRSPNAEAKSTNSAYYALTGPTTAFPADKKITFADISDGTSNTLITVEARRDIPWTKPEDIAYDSAQPLPDLGGVFDEGFNAGLMDGSVRFFSRNTDEGILRALFTRDGGEVISLP